MEPVLADDLCASFAALPSKPRRHTVGLLALQQKRIQIGGATELELLSAGACSCGE